MSAVNVASMAEIAVAHSLVVRPVDICPHSLAPTPASLEGAINDRTRMIVIAHLFGARSSLAPLAHLRTAKRLLVEDCAQAWSPSFWGSSEADISLFSFGPIKTATALGGSIALFRDPEVANAVRDLESTYSTLSAAWFIKRLLKYSLLKLLSRPTVYGLFARTIVWCRGDLERAIGSMARSFSTGELLPQIRKRPPNRLVLLLVRRLKTCKDVRRRQQAAIDILSRLAPGWTWPGWKADEHTFWVTPILVKDPDMVRNRLLSASFDATRGTTSLRMIGSDPSETPWAAHLLGHVLYLPSPIALDQRSRKKLVETISAMENQIVHGE